VLRSFILVFCLALIAASGCGEERYEITVDLRTDFEPNTEFDRVEASIEVGDVSRTADPRGVAAADDFITGERVATFGDLPPGQVRLVVTIRDTSGALVAERVSRLSIDANTGLTVLIARECGVTTCPGASDPGGVTECHGGRCVEPTCTTDNPDACGPPDCVEDADCTSTSACAAASCTAGACISRRGGVACAPGQACHPRMGCIADPGTDGGTVGPTGLLAHYRFDDDPNDGVEDSSGNGFDARCVAGCPAQRGGAYQFDGTVQVLAVDYDPRFDFDSGFTIAVFIEAEQWFGFVYQKPLTGFSVSSLELELQNILVHNLLLRSSPDGMAAPAAVSENLPGTMPFTHYAVTWDGNTTRFYVDGVFHSESTMIAVAPLYDGSDVFLFAPGDVGNFQGRADELRVYDRVLTDAEVAEVAAQGSP